MSITETSVIGALRNKATPDFIRNVVEGIRALEEHQYTDHEFELTNIIDGPQEIILIERVHDCVYSHLLAVCRIHRVLADETASIDDLAKLVRALILMQFWEDKDTIIALCDSDAEDEAVLACLVALVGALNEEQAGDIIQRVDPNFLKGLKNIYLNNDLSAETDIGFDVPREQIDKLKAYRDKMGAEKCLAFRMIKMGYQPGSAIEQYINKVVGTLAERDNKDIASELIPFLLMGRDTWSNPLAGWREHAKLFSLDAKDITAVDVEVVKLLGQFDRLITQTSSQ